MLSLSASRNAKLSVLFVEGSDSSMAQSEELNRTLEAVRQSVNSSGYGHLLGMQVERLEDGMGAVRIQVDTRLMHPQQIVHGGVIFTLADTAMSMAIISVVPTHTRFSTIEAKINYLQAVRTGELLAEAHIIQRGRTICVLESTVYNINGEKKLPIARVMGTFHISSSTHTHPQTGQNGNHS